MRATRAYIAGIGTSGVLLVFAALLLIVLGALLGFRGWPGGSTAQRIDTLVVEAPDRPLSIARPASDDRRAEGVRSPRAAEPDGGTARPAGSAVRDGALSTGSGRPLPGSTGATGEDRVAGGVGGGPKGAPSTAPPVSAPPAPPPNRPDLSRPPPTNPKRGISPITDGLGVTTEDLSDDLGLQVKVVSPPLGEVVKDGGAALGGELVDLGSLIDGTLPVLDQLPLPARARLAR